MKKAASILLLVLLTVTMAVSQEALKSTEEEYYDFLSLQGLTERPTLGYRTLSDSVWSIDEETAHVWKGNSLGTTRTLFSVENASSNWFLDGIDQAIKLRFYGPEWFNSYNKSVPFGFNDGALWQGVGYNTSFSTGVRLEGFGFELTFKPQIVFSQNLNWDYLTSSNGGPYGYFADYNDIDIVQRYGDTPFFLYSWGDSEIRWTWNTFTVGFGTQSPWLGPAYLNPMMGSNNADPYPKLDIGLRKTPVIVPWLNWNLGDIEARVLLGKLTQSDYYQGLNNDKPERMLTLSSISYAPSFINGLTFGMNRLFINYWDKENLLYLLKLFEDHPDNGVEDQKASLFATWAFPNAGFEVYGEIGIDDYSCYEFQNPFHTGIYTIGVKQITPITDSFYGILNLEWNSFEMSQDFQLQWQYGGFYFHVPICQGYTNNGQIVGASSGAMGNSQFIKYTLYYPKGKTSFTFHRYCPDNNFILNKAVEATALDVYNSWYAMYETYMTAGIETTFFITPSLEVSVGGTFIRNLFPKYQKETEAVSSRHSSFNVSFGAKYSF